MKIIKSLVLAVVIIAFTFMSGCNAGTSDLGKRLIVQMIYIEKDNDKYSVAAFEQGSKNKPGERADAMGNSFAEALNELSASAGKRILLSHTRTILLDSDMADKDMIKCVELLSQYNEVPLESHVIIAEGSSAQEVAQADMYEDAAVKVGGIFETSNKTATSIVTTVSDLLVDYYDDLSDMSIPVMNLKNGEISASGTAVFSKRKYVGKLDQTATRAVLLLKGKVKDFYIGTGQSQLNISRIKTKAKAKINNQQPFVSFHLTVYAQNIDDESSDLAAKEELEKSLTKQLNETVTLLKDEYLCDILNFRTMVFKSDKKYAKANDIESEEFLKKVNVIIDVDVIMG